MTHLANGAHAALWLAGFLLPLLVLAGLGYLWRSRLWLRWHAIVAEYRAWRRRSRT